MPNIRKLLDILATLLVTTAEAERVLSTVERTVTAARAYTTKERLEALVMLHTCP
jgi:hAT family C-terminal dimerisation region